MAISIRLDWVAPVGSTVDFYNVKRSLSGSGPFTTIGSSVTTTFTDATIVAGTTYYYEVTAANSAGESTASSVVNTVDTFHQVTAAIVPHATMSGKLVARSGVLGTGHATVTANLKAKGKLAGGATGHATITAKIHKVGDISLAFVGAATVHGTMLGPTTLSSAILGKATVKLTLGSNPVTRFRNSQLYAEAAVRSTASTMRETYLQAEVAVGNNLQQFRVSECVLEVAFPSSAVQSPLGPGTTAPNIWSAYIDTIDPADSGKQCLAIELNDNQDIVYNPGDPWYGCWVYSALMSCQSPNVIEYGARANWEFGSVNSNLLYTQRIGVVFYDKDLNYITEVVTDYKDTSQAQALIAHTANGDTSPYSSWSDMPVGAEFAIATIPENASFFRFECVALVSSTSGTVNTGIGLNNAKLMFDNLFAIQVPPTVAAGGGSTGHTIVSGNFTYTASGGRVTFQWLGMTILNPDGSTIQVAQPPNIYINGPLTAVGWNDTSNGGFNKQYPASTPDFTISPAPQSLNWAGSTGVNTLINQINDLGAITGSVDSGHYESTEYAIYGTLHVTKPGTYFFNLEHDDGALIGFGDGAIKVSGTLVNVFGPAKTAINGYPLFAGNNNSGSYPSDPFAVNFVAAGDYRYEINYTNWQHASSMILTCGGLNIPVRNVNIVSVTGIPATGSSYFYPYWDTTTSQVLWVPGTVGTEVLMTPQQGLLLGFTAPNAAGLSAQTQTGRIPLSIGPIQVISPGSGTGGGGQVS